MSVSGVQLIAEENQVRLELQMALDSKDSDIEQLRSQLSTLSVHSLDSTSISSGNDLELADGYPGRLDRPSPTLNWDHPKCSAGGQRLGFRPLWSPILYFFLFSFT